MGRLFAIGDIHGCADELAELINKIQVKADDEIVFLGDYVDRGPDSKRVIEQVIELSSRCKVVCLKGNHEAMFMDFLERPESQGAGLFVLNGGASTLSSYANADGSFEIPDAHLNFLYTLKFFYQTENHFFVHAGIPDIPLNKINAEDHSEPMLWMRFPFLSSTYRWQKLVVHGHTPVRDIEDRPNRLNLDTGCVYGGVLSAMELNSKTIFQVPRQPASVDNAKNRTARTREEGSGVIVVKNYPMALRFQGRMPVKARRLGDVEFAYETMNYNAQGLLLRSLDGKRRLAVGDGIEGEIGQDQKAKLHFLGRVVRVESNATDLFVSVQIERMSEDTKGHFWVDNAKKASGS